MHFSSRLNFSASKGFTVLEILIAVLVLAIGLLGFAAIQLNAINSSQEVYVRAQATSLAEAASANLLANRTALATYVNNSASQTYFSWCDLTTPNIPTAATYCPDGACDCDNDVCTADQVAAYDIANVCNQLNDLQLPSGEIGVQCNDKDPADASTCSPGSRLTVYVTWTPSSRLYESVGVSAEGNVARNVRCANNVTGIGDGDTCLMLEVIP